MSSTPTESEFDKELKLMIDEIGHAGANGDDRKETQTIYLKAIKQAVDKHVIGEDLPNNGGEIVRNTASEIKGRGAGSYSESCKKELRIEQRKALYGGDKK